MLFVDAKRAAVNASFEAEVIFFEVFSGLKELAIQPLY
jgi:hypothetical protein